MSDKTERKNNIMIFAILPFFATILCGGTPSADVNLVVNLGDCPSNRLIHQRVVLPVAAPVSVAGLSAGPNMVSVTPTQTVYQTNDVPAVDLEIDVHGVEMSKSIPPVMVKTDQGNFVLNFYVTAIPFSQYLPSRFVIAPGGKPVGFSFKGAASGVLWASLKVDPLGAPVEVPWTLPNGGVSLDGRIFVTKNPSLAAQDGILHTGTVTATTTLGETDFFQFQWLVPVPGAVAATSGKVAGVASSQND